MAEADCAAVAALVEELAEDTGGRAVPKLDAAALAAEALGEGALIDVTVAERGGVIAGACLALLTYSTWRAARGLYIVDLVVSRAARSGGLGRRLLAAAARRGRARGARFVKLEVDIENPRAARFYERIGFARKEPDRLFILEEEGLCALASEADIAAVGQND